MSPAEIDTNGADASQPDMDFADSPSSPEADAGPSHDSHEPSARAKRIACVICRKRKLRCDGQKPACGTCARLGHRCGYDEIRRKSGPKRGYVKELEQRLKVIESQLKSKQSATAAAGGAALAEAGLMDGLDGGIGLDGDLMGGFAAAMPDLTSGMSVPNLVTTELDSSPDVEFPWEMIGLGLEEPLPPQDMIDELHQIYFDKLHYTMPMIHKYRYLAALNLAPHMRPPVCLRYSLWALTCSVVEKYFGYAETFYQRARKYAESDEMRGHGEAMVTVGHCQAWINMCLFEFKYLFFPRAWVSAGRAVRMATMMGLNRQDGGGLEVKQTLLPPRDWTDREERRRTFWLAYCVDRYSSVGTGWPMGVDEADIASNLPSSNEDYEQSRAVQTLTLAEAQTPDGASRISSFGGVVVMTCIFGKNLTHLHRATDSDMPEDPSGEFWKRHHKLDSILMTTSMYLPDHMRLPAGIKDPNVVSVNMYIHTATICLHQAAILKAEKHNVGSTIVRESTARCFLAASEIVSLTKLCSPLEISYLNPITAFCLYVAARIFTHSYMKHPNNDSIRYSLNFLLSAMQAHRSKNPLTESFLVQLQVELDAAGLEHPLHNRSNYRGAKTAEELYAEGSQCPPVFPRQSDTQPSYQELQSNANSPPVIHSGVGSPQPFGSSAFTVPTRDSRPGGGQGTAGSTNSGGLSAPTVPSQASNSWGEPSPTVYTPSNSATGTGGSSTHSFSPRPQDDTGVVGTGEYSHAEFAGSGMNGTRHDFARTSSIPSTNGFSQQQQQPRQQQGQSSYYQQPTAANWDTSTAAFGNGGGAGNDEVLELPPDWVDGLDHAAWGRVMEGMNWDEQVGGAMPGGLG